MTTAPPNPDSRAGFCQQCGKPLTAQTRRTVGQAIFCEPCLEARLGAAPFPPSAGPSATLPPPGSSATNLHPWVAGLLGFIPGVGAMYNEQYSKGVAHLVVFALLVALSDANGLFGVFVAGCVFYMAIEAYHTAQARRDGLPLPNPFGFNDLGERFGFSRGWKEPRTAPMAASAHGYPPPMPGGPAPAPSPESWQAPVQEQPSGREPWQTQEAPPPFAAPYGRVPYTAPPFVPVGAAEPFSPAAAPTPATSLERVPMGAIVLILLGVLFLVSSSRHFREVSPEALLGLGLVALAGWIFLSRYRPLAADPLLRLSCAVQPSIWVFSTGVMALLDSRGILRWGRSWPIYLITAGVTALLRRAAAHGEPTQPTSIPPTPVQPAAGPHTR